MHGFASFTSMLATRSINHQKYKGKNNKKLTTGFVFQETPWWSRFWTSCWKLVSKVDSTPSSNVPNLVVCSLVVLSLWWIVDLLTRQLWVLKSQYGKLVFGITKEFLVLKFTIWTVHWCRQAVCSWLGILIILGTYHILPGTNWSVILLTSYMSIWVSQHVFI